MFDSESCLACGEQGGDDLINWKYEDLKVFFAVLLTSFAFI
jgi:hypothetical protein